MSKLYIRPYNDEGILVKRGEITLPIQATRMQVAKRVYQSITREGVTNIRHIEVVNKQGILFYAFDQRIQHIVQTDGEGSDDYENSIFTFEELKKPQGEGAYAMNDQVNNQDATDNAADEKALKAAEDKRLREAAKAEKEAEKQRAKEEREAAKAAKESERLAAKEAKDKEKADKEAAAEAAKAEKEAARLAKIAEKEAAKANKGPSKKDRVLELIRNGGTTIEAIVADLGVSDTAARSLVADVKRMGHTVVSTKDETTKVATFTLAA